MGLGFSQSSARWAYSGFHRFRCRLAKEIGVDLDTMAGFAKNGESWSNITDQIVPLLNHSDCDGILTVMECATVAPRLKELVSRWEDCYDKRQSIVLAEDMLGCAERREALEFC